MKIVIAAVGRLKDSGERELFERYSTRFVQSGRALGLGPIEIKELAESRKPDLAQRKAEEAARLLTGLSGAAQIVLDENGRQDTSVQFAMRLAGLRDGGIQTLAFLIGGPDGHGDEVLVGAPSAVRLSLGAMTLPHGLARVILAEQLYRATTILVGHPYHRS
ncbi:MAG: 23S rRNA (pseudouridine(1915)-N(3))-methyltransferase RlmH [Hyphomicrobiaceae bacterium]|nr:23S rRNA (pseudouridine(1915)-N(3))-methyltransferase RlmH [Hyphomicrobiaceae bacterium]